MKRGAKDYLSKDHLDVPSLLRAITSALERRRLEEQINRYTEELGLRNAQLEADLKMAQEVQQAFLPQSYPVFPAGVAPEKSALRFCHRYLPTTAVGGDFFDVIALPNNRAGVFISDVMGHGVRAALVTAILRALAGEVAQAAADPGLFLTELNRRLLGILKQTRMPMFASACYIVVDPNAGAMSFAIAGHPTPLHIQRQLARVAPLSLGGGKAGPALGVLEDLEYEVHTAPVEPHDAVVLYTDGLFEVGDPNGDLYGQDRLFEAIRRRAPMQTAQLFDELLEEIHQFSAEREFIDDVCLVGMDVVRVGP
jgi:sigma-B regulation protein RsbU (phosphoserine phosphatase)